MNFVDDVDFVSTLRGREVDLIAQVADIVHAVVGGGVDLDHIHEAVFVDGFAVLTFVARTLSRVFVETVHRLRQQTRDSGLARSAWTCEEIGVTDSICLNGVGQGLDDVVLSDHGIPLFGAVLAVEGLGHG